MDSSVLIVLVLISLGLIVGALVALWRRNRQGGRGIYEERLGNYQAPAPARQRQKPDVAPPQHAEQAAPPPSPPPPPAAVPIPRPSFGGSSEPEAPKPIMPAPAVPLQPQAPATSAPPQFSPPPPQPAKPAVTPKEAESPAPPQPIPAAPSFVGAAPLQQDEDTGAYRRNEANDEKTGPTEVKDNIPLSPPEPAFAEEEMSVAEPAPELPLLDLDEMPAEPDAEEVTRSGEATTEIGSLATTAQSVLFSAYYPREVVPEQWEKLHAYVFRAIAAAAVEEDAEKQLGLRAAEFRGVRAPAKTDVPEGAFITATPQMEGFQFNPPSVSLGFYKDWHRFDFELRAKSAPLNQSTNGLLMFSVEGILVADIPLSIYVGESISPSREQAKAIAKLYQAIFCSYSHQDQHVVARAERAYKALGLDYLRDVMSLKSGQPWSEELLNLINKADIFQLFWSHAAAESEHVRYEWEHALQVAGWRANFIRPVYWEAPQPAIPPELKHIHFAYQPDLGE